MQIRDIYKKIKYSIMGNYLSVYLNYLINNRNHFKTELAIVAIVKNEAPYIVEWIEFHKIVGVEKFYIYDNGSEDNLKELLQPYITNGDVEYVFYPGKGMQTKAYTDAVKKHRNQTKWLAMIDLDEFIVPLKTGKITDLLSEMQMKSQKEIAALCINWVLYGYSNHFDKPEGLVIKNFTKNEGENKHIKVIVNPRTVVYINNPHYVVQHLYGTCTINENHKETKGPFSESSVEKIRINHYFTKSYSEFTKKVERGLADSKDSRDLPPYDPNYASMHEDSIMEKYIPTLESICKGK